MPPATTKSEQQRIVEYWTPAADEERRPCRDGQREAQGKPGGGSGGGTAVLETMQQPRFGKVFFTEGRTNYVCSGTATTGATATS